MSRLFRFRLLPIVFRDGSGNRLCNVFGSRGSSAHPSVPCDCIKRGLLNFSFVHKITSAIFYQMSFVWSITTHYIKI
nr:MAG TPA: hypothetical protein [Caudoviricetes sp.]